ncbi:hypothetical protein [Amycolatopsis sulphurea]
MATTVYGCLFGGALLAPAAAYFGIVPTAAAYFYGLTHAYPVLGALYALLEPLTATVLPVAFLSAVGYWRPEPR